MWMRERLVPPESRCSDRPTLQNGRLESGHLLDPLEELVHTREGGRLVWPCICTEGRLLIITQYSAIISTTAHHTSRGYYRYCRKCTTWRLKYSYRQLNWQEFRGRTCDFAYAHSHMPSSWGRSLATHWCRWRSCTCMPKVHRSRPGKQIFSVQFCSTDEQSWEV